MNVRSFADDLLGLEGFARRLEAYLEVEHEYVPGSLVVSLNGKFGAGKTTFLKMWKESVKSRSAASGPIVIHLNAWESDYLGDPISAIISSLEVAVGPNDPNVRGIVQAAMDVGWFALAIGGQVASKTTGIDVAAAATFTESRSKARPKTSAGNAYSHFKERQSALVNLKRQIEGFVAAVAPARIIFLVDELDRCRPDYAIAYLETIKHVFDVVGLTFVLSVDRAQLESVARAIFGQGLDFGEYYRKFVHREVALPPISEDGYMKVAVAYVSEYLQKAGKRLTLLRADSVTNDRIVDWIAGLRLSPRQIQEVFRILGHVAAKEPSDARGTLTFAYAAAVIAMASLKVSEANIYHELGRGVFAPQRAKELCERTSAGGPWWLLLFFFGGGLSVPKATTPIAFADELGLYVDLPQERRERALSCDRYDWGHREKSLSFIYSLIEYVSTFS